MKLTPLNEYDPVFYVTKSQILEAHWPFWELMQKVKGNKPDLSQKADRELCVMHWCDMFWEAANDDE